MDDDELPIYARNLQKLMTRTLQKQSDIARKAGIARDAFGRYYHGKNRPPPMKAVAIARVLGCLPSEIEPEYKNYDDPANLPQDVDDEPAYMTMPAIDGDPRKMRLRIDADLRSETVIDVINLINADLLRRQEGE